LGWALAESEQTNTLLIVLFQNGNALASDAVTGRKKIIGNMHKMHMYDNYFSPL
jgi:hypothetical protein